MIANFYGRSVSYNWCPKIWAFEVGCGFKQRYYREKMFESMREREREREREGEREE
jgi:hypothetical protein